MEITLVVGIILAYLSKTKNTKYNKTVYSGLAAGLCVSVVAAFLFSVVAGGFSGRTEEIFEGVTMLFGAFLLSTMILWMMQNKHVAQDLKNKVSTEIKKEHVVGLFFLVFVSVLREGIETVIFLGAVSFAGAISFIGAVLGITTAVVLGYLIFVASAKINLKKFFNISSLLLLMFASGLVAHGVHELQEAAVLPIFIEHVWDINPVAPLAENGIYPLLHENGVIGSIAKGLFGYNANPSLLEILVYIGYLGLIAIVFLRIENVQLKRKISDHKLINKTPA